MPDCQRNSGFNRARCCAYRRGQSNNVDGDRNSFARKLNRKKPNGSHYNKKRVSIESRLQSGLTSLQCLHGNCLGETRPKTARIEPRKPLIWRGFLVLAAEIAPLGCTSRFFAARKPQMSVFGVESPPFQPRRAVPADSGHTSLLS